MSPEPSAPSTTSPGPGGLERRDELREQGRAQLQPRSPYGARASTRSRRSLAEGERGLGIGRRAGWPAHDRTVVLRAELLRQRFLVGASRDGHGPESHLRLELNAEVAQPAHAQHRDGVAGLTRRSQRRRGWSAAWSPACGRGRTTRPADLRARAHPLRAHDGSGAPSRLTSPQRCG
jgi:hypothetical protein